MHILQIMNDYNTNTIHTKQIWDKHIYSTLLHVSAVKDNLQGK
jgi:hypothetical protein